MVSKAGRSAPSFLSGNRLRARSDSVLRARPIARQSAVSKAWEFISTERRMSAISSADFTHPERFDQSGSGDRLHRGGRRD